MRSRNRTHEYVLPPRLPRELFSVVVRVCFGRDRAASCWREDESENV